MDTRKLGRFQSELWKERSSLDRLRAVIDPADSVGWKNALIDTIHKQQLSRALALRGDEKILDFGSGTGRISDWLAPQCREVLGIDTTPEMVQTAVLNNTRDNVKYVLYDGTHIPCKNGYFHVVISVGVLQHITQPEDLKQVLGEFSRVLTNSGKVCLIEQVSDHSSTITTMPADYIIRRTPRQYIDAFSKKGFDVEKSNLIRGFSIFTKIAQHGCLSHWLLPLLATAEASLASRRNLARFQYADCLFLFRKAVHPSRHEN